MIKVIHSRQFTTRPGQIGFDVTGFALWHGILG